MFSSQVPIQDVPPRMQAMASAGQTVYGTNFTANVASDILVYSTPSGSPPNDETQILSYPSQYSVDFIGDQQQVQVTLVTASNLGDIVTVVRNTPADRENLYSNTNFLPSMLNNDFGILTLVDQQAQLVNQYIAPRYNYSGQINNNSLAPTRDTILPLLLSNQFWAMDPTNTKIVAVDIGEIISGGTVTLVETGTGLTGGPITDAGTISFAPIAAHSFWANTTGGTAVPAVTPLSTFLLAANNLSDLTNVPQARINLGLQIGVNVQAYSAALTSIAGLTTAANNLIYTTASNTYAVIAPSASSVLISSAGSVPSWSSSLPVAVQQNILQLGAQIAALNMNGNLINNVTNPVSAQDAATKAYVDTAGGAFLPLAGGTMSGIINMNTHKITNLSNPSVSTDAANKAYVDTTVGAYLPLVGGTMSGAIDMGNHKVINVTDPSSSQDAVNLEYLNTQLGLYLALSGGTMTGVINMGSHKITSLTDPSNPQDAATKSYVDSVATGFTVKQATQAATTANLNATYLNGASGIGATLTNAGALTALVIDGYTVNTNDRILVKNQTTTYQNGIYVATNVGSGAVAWILTRSTDFDQPAEIQPGDLVIVNMGTVNAGTSWIQTDTVSAVGTDPIQFSQFTFSATSVLLKANNLSDVANTTTSFNNISPLTTKGDLIGFSTQNVRLAVGGTNGQILQVSSGAATGLAWSTATYPATTTINQILYSNATNTVVGLGTLAGGVLVTDASNVPQFLTNPSAAGKILQSGNAAIPTWSTPTYPGSSGTAGKVVISDGTNNVYSTPTFPNASATTRKIIVSDGTNWVASTETYAVPGTSGNVLTSDGTNWTSAAPTSTTLLTTKGDLFSFSTVDARLPVASGNGKILQVDSTASVGLSYSTPTYPSASGTAGQLLRSDGTNNLYSTTTYPNTNAINTLLYASSANVMAALTTANSSVLVTSAGGVPSLSTTLPASLVIPSPIITTGIYDVNGHEILALSATASAVNYLTLANSSAGNAIGVSATGSDSNIIVTLTGKGTGGIQISGTGAANNAAAGYVGEFVSSVIASASAVAVTRATNTDITSISLTAGDWDVWGNINYVTVGAGCTQLFAWTNTASVTSPDASLYNQLTGTALLGLSGLSVPYHRYSLAATTTIYMSGAIINSSGNGTACGGLYARRAR